jgi:hypothetical protein
MEAPPGKVRGLGQTASLSRLFNFFGFLRPNKGMRFNYHYLSKIIEHGTISQVFEK